MSTYVIGDVQGCFLRLQQLLEKLKFNLDQDELWFVGDLVNRGFQSLETLRFIKQLKHKKVVLGNHDLHALAVYYSVRSASAYDYLNDLLSAPDRDELFSWLLQQPLVDFNHSWNAVMVHAGIPAEWSIEQACALSAEVTSQLQLHPKQTLSQLFGNVPNQWRDSLKGSERLIAIVNYLTRMRYINQYHQLDFKCTAHPENKPDSLTPWFEFPRQDNVTIFFGHWASLNGETRKENRIGLDTGCVWGNALTAYCLETKTKMSVT